MRPIIVAAGLILGGALLHLLFLWMERRGWIYYKHNKPSRTALGNAFLEIQSILEPEKKHIIEVKREDKKQNEEAGDEADDAENEE